MLLHRGVYFWMRAVFQIIAFSFLIVTLLMLINFGDGYWHSALAMIVVKHCLQMMAYFLDLTAFSMRKLHLIKYKLMLDVISIALIIAVQFKLFSTDLSVVEAEEEILNVAPYDNGLSQAAQVRRWIYVELALFYVGLLVQLIFLLCIACAVNSERFQDDYYYALRGMDARENDLYKKKVLS